MPSEGRFDLLFPALLGEGERWARLWGLPDLLRTVHFAWSGRLRSSLARCRPTAGRVTLRADLAEPGHPLLAEVLCHELAHVAVHRRRGGHLRPHGREWRHLVALAGFVPRTRVPGDELPGGEAGGRAPSAVYEHRCPVCRAMRLARRPVTTWRCADCLDAGLSGELEITRRRRPSAGRP